jgi:CPA2 family monovalent cation:H+ antiporter-2
MLLDPAFLVGHLGVVSVAAIAVVAGKTAITAGVVALLGMPWRIALAVGLFLGQVGEFSLVLLNVSRSSAEFPATFGQMALSVILITMVLAPFLQWSRIASLVTRPRPQPSDCGEPLRPTIRL